MRVAIVGLYPRDPERIRGGVEAVTLRLSEGLARLPDVEVHVVVSEAGREPGTIEPVPGLTVHSIGAARRFGNVLFALPDRRRIARALRRIRPDVVHAHSAHREALGAIESGLPVVITIHGILEREIGLEARLGKRLRGWFRRRLVDRVFDRAANIIVLSPVVADHYRDRLAHARTWTIENPVHERFFRPAETGEPGIVLFAGLIIPRKGVRNLLEAFHLARRQVPGARLRLAGLATIPEYESEVRETVRRLGLGEAVEFLGGLPPERLAQEYGRAACVVLVSKQETLPVAIQEAMAAGRPVIASPVGGVARLVRDGENGFLVPHGDPEGLAKRLVDVLSDGELRNRLGARGREIAEARFTVESVCRRTVAVYREVIERHRQRRGNPGSARPQPAGSGGE